jgi:vacuolar-type H+-ATPase subunit H
MGATDGGGCVEDKGPSKPAESCLCANKDKNKFKKKACPPPLPPSPPCPCIADCFDDEYVTDVNAIREQCYQELCGALRDLEAEKEAARKVIEKADAQFESRKEKCCEVMDDVVQRANKLRAEACSKIKEVEQKAIELREEAKRRVREAQQKECEERAKMEARKSQLMNEALEFKVNLAEKCMKEALEMAVNAEMALANIVKCYLKALESAVRSIQDPCDLENDPFVEVQELLEARQCLVEETMMKSGLFREAADTYRKIVEDGRMCPEVCSNPILEGAEKKIRCMIDELDEASNATRLVLCEVTGLKSLKDALKNSWRFMLPMMQTIVPDLDPCDPCNPITIEQMNVMVIYLLQKYLRAAVELEECKATMPPTCDDKAPPLDCEALLYGSKACQPECRADVEALVQKRILEMLRSCCPVDPCTPPEPCL